MVTLEVNTCEDQRQRDGERGDHGAVAWNIRNGDTLTTGFQHASIVVRILYVPSVN